ncbi:conserved membrane protein of unknown function [Pseudomonas marincola]|uniref:EpsG family protein n=1 Tax=Pseudomonas marincola TaxID=437900 RepID=A0A653E7A9_9PSED|nr:EpsG family protein [Pseudomonas marincola]CAE6910880.1 conserved membrane protein of unknown function [Pseudomonas marincola]
MSKLRFLSVNSVFFLFAFMWLLYGWNGWNGDRDAYELYYNTRTTLGDWGREIGYGYLNITANSLDLKFQHFQIVVAFITLVILLDYFLKAYKHPLVCTILFFLLFFPLDYVLMRNFLAFAVCLQAIHVLMTRGARILYVVLILAASTIHQSSVFLLVFLGCGSNRVTPALNFIFMLLLFYIFYFVLRSLIVLPDGIAAHLAYYATSLKSSLANVGVHLFSTLLMCAALLVERKSLLSIECRFVRDRQLAFMFNFNIFSLFLVVLYFESEIFVRLLRFIIFLNLMFCLNSLFIKRQDYLFILLYILIFSLYAVLFFIAPVAGLSIEPMMYRNLIM